MFFNAEDCLRGCSFPFAWHASDGMSRHDVSINAVRFPESKRFAPPPKIPHEFLTDRMDRLTATADALHGLPFVSCLG